MRCLLDKVTVRYAVQGLLGLATGHPLTLEELFALDLVERSSQRLRLFISSPSFNILQKLSQASPYAPIIAILLKRVQVAYPARYYTRWTRRLRERGFTSEDAALLALATFGTDVHAGILGMEIVATFDQPMINNWQAQQAAIRAHLAAMQQDLAAPYRYARLPLVLRPEQIDQDGK